MNLHIDSMLKLYESGQMNRRQLTAALATLVSGASLAGGACGQNPPEQKTSKDVQGDGADHPPHSDPPQPAFEARSLNHVTLSVSDVPRSQAFYERVLGIKTVSTQRGGVNLGLGEHSFLGLYAIAEPPRVNHFCVGLDEYRVQAAAQRLRQFGIRPRVRKDKPEVYFEDPDGITVQLEHKTYRG